MKHPVALRRPTPVLNATRILILCLGLELAGFAFSGDYSTGGIIGVVLGATVIFWLVRRLHAGVNWAKLSLLGLIAVGAIGALISFAGDYHQHPGTTVINFISTCLSIIAAVLLCTKESKAWFSGVSHR